MHCNASNKVDIEIRGSKYYLKLLLSSFLALSLLGAPSIVDLKLYNALLN